MTFRPSIDKPTGLHPTLRLDFPNPPSPAFDGCALHAYLTLPSTVFIDRYSLRDPLALASHNLIKLHALSGATDLEAPEWKTNLWGSAALLEFALPPGRAILSNSSSGAQPAWSATVPLHARYLPPTTSSDDTNPYRDATFAAPAIFFACPVSGLPHRSSDDLTGSRSFHINPFDRTSLGYDMYFQSESTIFFHVTPDGVSQGFREEASDAGNLFEVIELPILGLGGNPAWTTSVIDSVTVWGAFLGFAWVVWCLLTSPISHSRWTKKRQ